MSKSLQDQLLGAGLVDGKKAKKVAKEKRKEKNVQRRSKQPVVNESQEAVKKQLEDKKSRDRELNLQRQAEADKKALAAQVAQLVKHYQLNRAGGDSEYNFSDGKKIKKLLVKPKMLDELARGRLCIVRVEDSYEVIPKPIADKIRERDDTAVVVYNAGTAAKTEFEAGSDEEYYAQFEIPDDLDW